MRDHHRKSRAGLRRRKKDQAGPYPKLGNIGGRISKGKELSSACENYVLSPGVHERLTPRRGFVSGVSDIVPGLAEVEVAPALAEEEIDVRLPELFIHDEFWQRKVLNVQMIHDEVIYFTESGLYVSTRKGCVKLSK